MQPSAGLLAQGAQLQAQKQFAQAEQMYRQVLAQEPGNTEAAGRLSTLLRQTRRAGEAVALLEPRAMQANASPALIAEFGWALVDARQFQRAEQILKPLVDRHPDTLSAMLALAHLFFETKRFGKASLVLSDVAEREPNNTIVRHRLGVAYLNSGNPNKAIDALEVVLRTQPKDPLVNLHYGKALQLTGRVEDAEPALRKAQQHLPNHPEVITALVSLYFTLNRLDDVEQLVESRRRAGVTPPEIWVAAAQLEDRRKNREQARDYLLKALEDEQGSARMRPAIYFQLARAYEALGEYDKAFHAFAAANQALNYRHSRPHFEKQFDDVIRVFTKDRIRALKADVPESDHAVFVLGMPRSGTTLVEQIISSHPDVCAGGERFHLGKEANELPQHIGAATPYPQCIESAAQIHLKNLGERYISELRELDPEAARLTDKMPANIRFAGLIEMALPGAHVVHCTRHPIDTCFSIFATQLNRANSYSTDLVSIAHYYKQYRRLLAHWNEVLEIPMLDVAYESVVESTEARSRDLISFCGLEWNDACLRFHEHARAVTTMSVHQVRQPIYRTSIARNAHYEKHLGPLFDELAEFLD